MKQLIKGGRVWHAEHRWMENCPILIEDGKILSVGVDTDADEVIDAVGLTVIPGLVDVHTHGRAGYDFNTATKEQMEIMKADYIQNGVTSVFPTLASATEEEWMRSIKYIQDCGFDGIHLEGCYLNPAKRGAHAPELLLPLDANSLERILKKMKLPCHLSAAFELDEDGSFAEVARKYGATMGLGHTAATAEEANAAVERGVTAFTHLYNAMPPLHHREGGAVCIALTGDGWVEVIADGMHICPDMVKLAWRCKSKDKLVLITDSMEATGCPDGEYAIAGQKVIVRNGRAETLDGALAGSTLNLWDGVRNFMKFTGASLEDAVACATINPAEMVGIEDTVGSIEAGKRADLLLIDETRRIVGVIDAGKRIV